jgi:hypothetical protein
MTHSWRVRGEERAEADALDDGGGGGGGLGGGFGLPPLITDIPTLTRAGCRQ